jgi:hypothetical protein
MIGLGQLRRRTLIRGRANLARQVFKGYAKAWLAVEMSRCSWLLLFLTFMDEGQHFVGARRGWQAYREINANSTRGLNRTLSLTISSSWKTVNLTKINHGSSVGQALRFWAQRWMHLTSKFWASCITTVLVVSPCWPSVMPARGTSGS